MRQITTDPRIEEGNIIGNIEISAREIALQCKASGEEAVLVELHSSQGNTKGMRTKQVEYVLWRVLAVNV